MAKSLITSRPFWLAPLVAGGVFLALLLAEKRRPLRDQREPWQKRTARNLTMAGLSAVAAMTLQNSLLVPLTRSIEENHMGLLQQLRLAPIVRTAVGVLMLDYTLWWWHWLNHKVPLLWRFHLVHHVDRDLDASTALRFHFGEMSLSVLYRMAQMFLLGIDRNALAVWNLMLMVSILFHHSNLRLDPRIERLLVRLIVTPRMHGIHHSDYQKETDSNWSSLLSCWDALHGTLKLNIPQDDLTIGVPAYQEPDTVTIGKIISLPFIAQRADWVGDDGTPKVDRTVPGANIDPATLAP